jgi:hypothetical protein
MFSVESGRGKIHAYFWLRKWDFMHWGWDSSAKKNNRKWEWDKVLNWPVTETMRFVLLGTGI